MSLTGRLIIALSIGLTIQVAAATALLWRRGGRLRLPFRVAGLLALEVLIVLSAALIVNRSERFYPSWQSLTGEGQVVATVGPAQVGRLDGTLRAGTAVAWSPPEAAGWHLAGPAILVVPLDYGKRDGHAFPVLVALTSADQAAAVRAQASAAADVLTVVAVPTRETTALALATLPTRLAQDARTAATGWAIVADPAHSKLARQWHDLIPARFHTVTDSFAAAVDRLPAALGPPVRLPS